MLFFTINREELEKALAQLKKAERNGFCYCLAFFDPEKLDKANMSLRYADLLVRAHPTKGMFNYGRYDSIITHYRFQDGKLVPLDPAYEKNTEVGNV